MPNGRCRMHGGKSPGAPRGNKNAYKHGHADKLVVAPSEPSRAIEEPIVVHVSQTPAQRPKSRGLSTVLFGVFLGGMVVVFDRVQMMAMRNLGVVRGFL